jgi:ADP-heptose:LPS heptosyltransferase
VKINKLSRIIVSRTDSIGDVALTLPLCLWLKSHVPEATLVYLCKSYTKDFVQCFEPVDEILLLEDLENSDQNTRNALLQCDLILHVFPNKKIASWAKHAGIPHRIGTSHRWFHWLNCNIRVSFTRKKSPLHEAQLNFNLLKPLGLETIPKFEEIKSLKDHFIIPTEPDFFPPGYVILHPLSQGSAINYPLIHYVALAEMLAKRGKQVLITGTAKEGIQIGSAFDHIAGVENVCGKFSLGGLISLISKAHALIACSTGPLHIAGILDIRAIGLFSSRIPIHPGRWKPLGKHSIAMVKDPLCERCAKGLDCRCIEEIPVEAVVNAV